MTMEIPKTPSWGADLDDRELTEIRLAVAYTKMFNHGTSGHLAYNVIAKLARKLDNLTERDYERMTGTYSCGHAITLNPPSITCPECGAPMYADPAKQAELAGRFHLPQSQPQAAGSQKGAHVPAGSFFLYDCGHVEDRPDFRHAVCPTCANEGKEIHQGKWVDAATAAQATEVS